MDDLKLRGKSQEELQKLIQTVKTFTHDTLPEFKLHKYPTTVFQTGTNNNREIHAPSD
jgi:hypothetical protein